MDIISMVELLFIGTAFILMVYFALTAIYKIAYQIERIHVVHTSDRYRYLLQLPAELKSEPLDSQYAYQKQVKSKAQIDRIDVDKQMMNLIADGIPPSSLIRKVKYNQEKMREYDDHLRIAPPYKKPKRWLYARIEKDLTAQLEEQAKPVIPTFAISFLPSKSSYSVIT